LDWSEQFKSLLSSPLGQELLNTLNQQRLLLLDEAAKARTQEQAFGLLKEAGGVIKAIEHLQFRAVVPKDEGSKNPK
jgi:hypothetical protein